MKLRRSQEDGAEWFRELSKEIAKDLPPIEDEDPAMKELCHEQEALDESKELCYLSRTETRQIMPAHRARAHIRKNQNIWHTLRL